MAVPTVRSSASQGENSGSSVTVNKPTGTTSGDLLVIFTTHYNDVTSWPSGFTEFDEAIDSGGEGEYLTGAWKEAGGSEPSTYTINFGGTDWSDGIIVAIQGADTTSPIDVTASRTMFSGGTGDTNDSGDESPDIPAHTTTQADTLALGCITTYNTSLNTETITNWTNVNRSDYIGCWSLDQTSSGSQSIVTNAVSSGFESSWVSFRVAIAPASSGLAISPTGVSVTATAGTVTVTTGAVAISPTGASVTATAGTVTVTSSFPISPTGASVAVSAGSVTVTTGAVAISPTGASVAVTAGTVTVAPGAVAISPVGASVAVSAGSVTVSGASVPAAVADLAGTAGDGQVVLTWSAPDDGGDTITDYIVQYRIAPG